MTLDELIEDLEKIREKHGGSQIVLCFDAQSIKESEVLLVQYRAGNKTEPDNPPHVEIVNYPGVKAEA